MTAEEIFAGESENVEFKSEIPAKSEKYMKTVVAFANGKGGKLVFGVGLGLITCAIRFWGNMAEGVSYAILIMNCCVGFFDRIGVPKRFGAVRQKKQKKGGAEA